MWFVSKKKYNAMVAERDKWDGIAAEAVQLNERVISHNERILQEMREIQILNLNIQQRNEELLAHCKRLEADLQMARQTIQQWADDFEELDIAYGQLEAERDTLRERVEAFEEGMYITREAE